MSSPDSTVRPRRRRLGPRSIAAVAAAGTLAFAISRPTALACQAPEGPDLDALPDTPGATMGFLVERTIFKVDVLRIGVRVDPGTAGELRALTGEHPRFERGLEERVAELVRHAPEAVATIRFVRHITLSQFLEGVDEDMGRGRDAGWITPATFRLVSDGLREWFAFLERDGIESGDRLTYHIRGDTLRTTYLRAGSSTPSLDQTDVGAENVQALWGGYYAPGSSFREKLVRSLWKASGASGGGGTPREEGTPFLFR